MEDRIIKTTELLKQTLLEKNKKYKNSFHNTMDKYGQSTLLIRLSDKLQRLESLLLDGESELDDESLLDTLLDLAGYAVLGRIYFEESERK